MSTILFNEIVFGPIYSRRLGISLGINLLPNTSKVCSFDCIYCECGYNAITKTQAVLPSQKEVKIALSEKLMQMKKNHEKLDTITFAGNGEPTLHPDFESIIENTITLRNEYFPNAKVSVLSNASMVQKEQVFRGLNKVDNNILKLDTAFDDKLKLIDNPNIKVFNIQSLVQNLKKFNGNLVIQTMFLRGEYKGEIIDNTTEKDISAWIKLIQEINPKQVMIYTIDRETPEKNLEKIPLNELNEIAKKLERLGYQVNISG